MIELYVGRNQLTFVSNNIDKLSRLRILCVSFNQLSNLPNSVCNIIDLGNLFVSGNQINSLPDDLIDLKKLTQIHLNENPITDFSILQNLPSLEEVEFFNIDLPRRYWTKLSNWNSEWLLDEENDEFRRVLIQQIGYDRICQELDAIDLDTWREYTLLKIDDAEDIYDWEIDEEIGREPMNSITIYLGLSRYCHDNLALTQFTLLTSKSAP